MCWATIKKRISSAGKAELGLASWLARCSPYHELGDLNLGLSGGIAWLEALPWLLGLRV